MQQKKFPTSLIFVIFLFLAWSTSLPYTLAWEPPGKKIICPITRDTWLSSVANERNGSNGASSRLKLKGQQEYTLLDIDPAPLKGKQITGALLHIRSAAPKNAPPASNRLMRVGVSTVASPWIEGTSQNYLFQIGTSCFEQAELRKKDWAYPGSTLMDVVFGRGHTLWKFADASPPDENDWQTVALEPDVVSARVSGLSEGFCLYDEVGSIWQLQKGKFEFTHFPNRFCYSRENGKYAPWMEVWVQGTDAIPPDPIQSVIVETNAFPKGEALVRWKTPEDRGGGKTLGFHVTYKTNRVQGDLVLPRYLIPMAKKPGEEVRMYIQDLNFKPNEEITLFISPVDNVGNIGKALAKALRFAGEPHPLNIPAPDIEPFPPSTQLPTIGKFKVAVTDLLDKITPDTGEMIPPHPDGYKGGNHIFSAKKRLVRLQAARNETIAFQLNLESTMPLSQEDWEKEIKNLSFDYTFENHLNLKPKLYQFGYVKVSGNPGKRGAFLPDPLIPLVKNRFAQFSHSGSANISLICELYIPHEESPGKKTGAMRISAGRESLDLIVALEVWNFTLPNQLSFVPEMNVYGTVSPYDGYEYYRLAHEHRTCINRLPYGWNGQPAFAPKWTGNDFDWQEWDQKVGPLLDGSAFKDMPRKNEPVDVLYLPFSENYPVSLFQHYTPSFWADEAFAPDYGEELKRAFSAFARHCEEKKWYNTIFEFYLNNKVYYRKHYPKNSAPWIFDEPVNTQDFWAVRWYGLLWHQAVNQVAENTKMWYRADISYTQFARNTLWGITDIEYLGGNNPQKTRMKQDEQVLTKNPSAFAEYGTTNPIDQPNTQPVLWSLAAWSKGAAGVLPWQTMGSQNCWKNAEQTALFYPHPKGPRASVRLKAFTRGEQDVEYLMLVCDTLGIPRFAVADWLNNHIDLKGKVHKSAETDAGTAVFDSADSLALWQMRYALGKVLSARAPEYKRSLTTNQMSGKTKWDINNLPDIGYVSVSPDVRAYKPVCDRFAP